MPSRVIVAKELSSIFKVLSHPDRVRIAQEIGNDEKDVNTLAETLGLSHSRVSQHLSVLRNQFMAEERRDGRHRFYRLTRPDMANWIIGGLAFIESHGEQVTPKNISSAKRLWLGKKT